MSFVSLTALDSIVTHHSQLVVVEIVEYVLAPLIFSCGTVYNESLISLSDDYLKVLCVLLNVAGR